MVCQTQYCSHAYLIFAASARWHLLVTRRGMHGAPVEPCNLHYLTHTNGAPLTSCVDSTHEQLVLSSVLLGFPGGAFAPDLVNQTQHLFASHQGDSLRELASVAVDHPMTSEGLVDASAGDSHRSLRLPSTSCSGMMSASKRQP